VARKPLELTSFTIALFLRVEKGLEVSLVAVVDVETETGYVDLGDAVADELSLPFDRISR
jgi:hypothetical protein